MRLRLPPPRLTASAAVALLLVHPHDRANDPAFSDLKATLAAQGVATEISDAADAALDDSCSLVFELSAGPKSFEILEQCGERGFYRYQRAANAFKKLSGDGPSWISPEASFSNSLEQQWWGFIDNSGGEEPDGLDVTKCTDEELARLMDLEPTESEAPQADAEAPTVSALGYALDGGAAVEPLTPLARRVLYEAATEPPHSKLTASGAPWPAADQTGAFLCAASGVPLYTTEDVISAGEWPGFRAPAADDARSQHLATRPDYNAGTRREELIDVASGAHLGHRFDNRECVNGAALCFVPRGEYPRAAATAAPALAALLAARPEYLGRARVATFAAGCFWGVRQRLEATPGVLVALAGFCGGQPGPTSYEAVSAGGTGHVEAVQLAYDPEATGFGELLDVFWALHDPTSELRQGADAGEQYRCAVFYHSDAQRRAAEEGAAQQQRERGAEVKTRVRAAGKFEVASEEHQRKSGGVGGAAGGYQVEETFMYSGSEL